MSETICPSFTVVKDGVFFFSRRVPKELKSHYLSPRIAYSLRTTSAKIAEARARRAADQLDEYWYHLRSQEVALPGKHMLRQKQKRGTTVSLYAPAASDSSVFLSEAVSIYLQQKGRGRPVEPPPLKWSVPIVGKTEDLRWPLRDPSPKRLS
jgi:hypothetical protein